MRRYALQFLSLIFFLGLHLSAHATSFPLKASYTVDNFWPTGYQATVTLTNQSSTPTSTWSATFNLPQGQSISSLWNGAYTANGQTITVNNPTWVGGGTISAGGTTTFGMIVNMPNQATPGLSNLQATANGTPPPPPTIPKAPVLNSIKLDANSSNSYTVSWSSVANATSYILQQDSANNFPNPQVITQGNVLSYHLTNQAVGTYFYRVIASNTAGNSPYSNISSINIKQTPPPTIPQSPVLNPITLDSNSSNSYMVSWNSVANATSYSLQQDSTSNFSNPQVIAQGNILSYHLTNQAVGSYFYRVVASNTAGNSPYSNVESINITQTPPPSGAIEHSVWYIDWTSWFNGPPFVLPSGVNVINVFVGELTFGADGKPTLDGFGTMNLSQMDAFTAYCKAQNPPIDVKVSIGGGGGSYDRCWDLLTSTNVNAFAQGLADFCHAHGLIGIDFDYEEYASAAQETLVGTLIKQFKTIDPNLQTSICTNAGFGPNYPWQQVVQNILDAAMIAPNNSAVDRVYIMTYYDSMQNEENWVVGSDGNGGWANWLKTNYGFSRNRISIGIDDFDAHAYDPVAFAAWATSQGFSTAHWAFDPAHPK